MRDLTTGFVSGFAIVTLLATRLDAVIFAGARNPDGATGLQDLAKANPGRFQVIKVVSADKENNIEAANEIKRVAGRLDVVIANAAISESLASALEVPAEEMVKHFDVSERQPTRLPAQEIAMLFADPD